MPKVHRAFRHTWVRPPNPITDRDCQAMWNFAKEGISLVTIAEHFSCNVAFVYEQVTHRPWLRSRPARYNLGQSSKWLVSDHGDPLELVKLYYPQYLCYLPGEHDTQVHARETKYRDVSSTDVFLHGTDSSFSWEEIFDGTNYGKRKVELKLKR